MLSTLAAPTAFLSVAITLALAPPDLPPPVPVARATAVADTLLLTGRVEDGTSGDPIAGAVVEELTTGARTETGRAGRFALRVIGAERPVLRVWAYGYRATEHHVVEGAEGPVFRLYPRPVGLPGLTARAVRTPRGAVEERALYEREVTPSVVGLSGDEAAALPVTAEPDLLRSLQSLPGVLQVNDLSARLHVRGGGPDQNLFLMDGTRIYAPYHMFGIFGSFNPDAVGRVEFFRGAIPARYGGALSSVVEMEQRDGSSRPFALDLGASLLAARATGSGRLPFGEGRWMLAYRRSLVDRTFGPAFGVESPVSFHDGQGRLSFALGPAHRVRATYYASGDDFRMFLDGRAGDLTSDWSNRAGSLRWDAELTPNLSAVVTAWGSGYDAAIRVSDLDAGPTTRNEVGSGGLRAEAAIRGGRLGSRIGLDVEGGRVAVLGGSRAGGYVDGQTRDRYTAVAAYGEAEATAGPWRLAPGLRVTRAPHGRWLVGPRLAARLALGSNTAVALSAGRTHQWLSTLRDDRYILPGAPVFFLHPESAPVARSDGVSLALDGWIDRGTSFNLTGFGRRFDGTPWWRPEGDRGLDRIEYTTGRAIGFEAMVRRHYERLHGWIGYGLSWTDRRDPETGERVAAPWDRRHAVDAAAVWEVGGRVSLSARATYGTGLPFLPQAGLAHAKWLDPDRGRLGPRAEYPLWAGELMRLPDHFRLDLAVRGSWRFMGADWEPYFSVVNGTARPNVLYSSYEPEYDLDREPPEPVGGLLLPRTGPFPPFIPSFGLDIRF